VLVVGGGVLVVRGVSGMLGAGGGSGALGVPSVRVLGICSASITFILLDRVIAIAIMSIISS
jgi:hypothetical protein